MDLPRSTFKKGSKIWCLANQNSNFRYDNEWNPNRIITLRDFGDRTVAMGTIAAIHAHGLEIHLLNNMIGFANYRNIYSKDFLVRHGIKDILTYWHKHKRQFPIGSDVIVRRQPEGDSSSGYLPLTLNPEDVNEDLTDELLEINMLIPAIVKSIEPHGLLLEVPVDGNKSLWKGFVSFHKQKMKVSLGNLVYVVITHVNFEGKIIKCDWPSHTQPKYTVSDTNITSIRPGAMVSTTVDLKKYKFDAKDSKLPFPAAIKVTILDNLSATLPTTHLCKYSLKRDNFILAKHSKTSEDNDVSQNSLVARITLVNYDSNEIYVSLLPTVLMWKAAQSETYTLKKSMKFTDCTVIRTYNNYGLQLLIPSYSNKSRWQKSVGFLHSTMGYKEDSASTSSVSRGKERYREVYYNYFERWSVLTSKSVDSKYRYMSPQHLPSGTIIRCRIEKILTNGVILRTVKKGISKSSKGVGDGLKYTSPFSVWIQLSHLTDIPLTTLPKRFKVGKVLRARVLEFDFTRKLIIATGKKSLVNDKNPLINVYSVKAGQKVTGFISLNGEQLLSNVAKKVTIKFFSGIRAVLSQTDQAKMLQEGVSIRNGTVVTGCVTKVYQDTNRVEIECK